MTQDLCREAFEKWYIKRYLISPYRKGFDRVFSKPISEMRWNAWQAAWNARSDALEQALNRPPKPLPELKKLMEKPRIWEEKVIEHLQIAERQNHFNPADTSQNVEHE